MKFLRFIAILAVAALALTGCQNQTERPQSGYQEVVKSERRVGEIKSLGGAYSASSASNILHLADGTTILLKSDNLDLDDDKYSDVNVEVNGVISTMTDGSRIMDVSSIDILETEKEITEELPEWVDYDGEMEGVKFTYRDDYELTDAAGEIFIRAPIKELEDAPEDEMAAPSTITIAQITSTEEQTLGEFLNIGDGTDAGLLAEGYTKTRIGMDSVDALKTSEFRESAGSYVNRTTYYVKAGEFIYDITFFKGKNLDTLGDENMFFDILGSLEFEDIEASDEKPSDEFEVNYALDPDGEMVEEMAEEAEKDEIDVPELNLTGYEEFESSGYDFKVSYPGSYYFAQSDTAEDAIGTFEFGTEPLEEADPEITVNLKSGALPNGEKITSDIVVSSDSDDSDFTVVVKGSSRLYEISGPSSFQAQILNMARSIED